MSKVFYVWIDLLAESSLDILTSSLLRGGFSVMGLVNSGNLFVQNKERPPSCLVSLNMSVLPSLLENHPLPEDQKEVTPIFVRNNIRRICGEKSIKYFSIVVTEETACAWYSSNFSLPEATEAPKVVETPKVTQNLFEESLSTDLMGPTE